MNTQRNILFKGKAPLAIPFLGLDGGWGKEMLDIEIDNILPFWQIQFRLDEVTIRTSFSDEPDDVDLTVFDGLPGEGDILPDQICTEGIIVVGTNGIQIDSGGATLEVLPWPKGITLVHVVLDAIQMKSKEIKEVFVFIKFFGPISKRSFLQKYFSN